ncbi:M50 family metallopeptidase [Aurantiacibacter sediminis]|uniref:M50 family metallopeptidase n=1 Tax=Aurantiacibacter sediminis TaxID=2793064 RepID=A0ABS0MZL6_9SPHN|nr:M50 family metallopeptidase [Aurantiacibacter sediminis]MBH5321154.1 M50 family metallopeptidase [Aurantiacibacter sediminis]
MNYGVRKGSQEEQVGRLVLTGVLVIALPALPFGNYLLFPFTILTTWFHEMGHGLTAMLLGLDFERLVLLPNGSGYAESTSSGPLSAPSRALIAAGGPIGPSVFGAGLIIASSRREWWKPALLGLAAIIALSVVIWVRSLTGLIVLPLLAAGLIWIALKGKAWAQRFTLQFLGVLAALSMFRDWDYLFSEGGLIGGRAMPSDTAIMEQALFLPHWLWAGLIIAISGALIGFSLKYALNRQG